MLVACSRMCCLLAFHTLPRALPALYHLSLTTTSETDTITVLPILQWENWGVWVCKWLAQCHTSNAQQHWDLKAGPLGHGGPIFLLTLLIFSKNISVSLLPLFLCLEQSSFPIFQILSLISIFKASSKSILLGRLTLSIDRGVGSTLAPSNAPWYGREEDNRTRRALDIPEYKPFLLRMRKW